MTGVSICVNSVWNVYLVTVAGTMGQGAFRRPLTFRRWPSPLFEQLEACLSFMAKAREDWTTHSVGSAGHTTPDYEIGYITTFRYFCEEIKMIFCDVPTISTDFPVSTSKTSASVLIMFWEKLFERPSYYCICRVNIIIYPMVKVSVSH